MKSLIRPLVLALVLLTSFSLHASGSHSNGSGNQSTKATSDFKVDASHSKLGFKVAHLGITSVSGYFKSFEGKVSFQGEKIVSAEASVKVPSIFTDNTKRDNHLKADDFFSAEAHPLIKFKSTSVMLKGKDLTIVGALTIRDVTKPVTLKGTYNGKVFVEAWGVHKTGFSVKGTINRQDFGLKFNQFLGTGEAMVGDEVELIIDIQADKKA